MTTHKANSGQQDNQKASSTAHVTPDAGKPSVLQPVTNKQAAPIAISMPGASTPAKGAPIYAALNPTAPIASTAPAATLYTAPSAASASAVATSSQALAQTAVKQDAKTGSTAKSPAKPKTTPKAPVAKDPVAKTPAAKVIAQKSDTKASFAKPIISDIKTAEKAATAKPAPVKAVAAKPAPVKAAKPQIAQAAAPGKKAPDAKPASTSSAAFEEARADFNPAQFGFDALQGPKEFWTKGLTAGLAAASHNAAILHGKMFDLVRSQTDSTIDLWRKLLATDSMAEAVALQTSEMRRQFEESTHQLKDIAQTTNRLLTETLNSSLNRRD